jgi:hypothetical protein
MKSRRPTLALAVLALLPAARADVFNRVTISGKVVSATTPVITNSGSSSSSISKLVSRGITNASILDVLVTRGELPAKTGYTIIELLGDDGVSTGFFAYNPKTGQTVELDPDLFAGLSDSKFVTATSTSARQTPSGMSQTYSTVNTGTGSAKLFGTTTSAFFNSTTALRKKDVVTGGVTTSTPYVVVSYTASLRGVSAATQLIDAKVASTGSTYLPPR